MKYRIEEIKRLAKNRISQRYGDALLIIFVPFILSLVISTVLGSMLGGIEGTPGIIINEIIGSLIGYFISFISLFLIIRYARGYDGFDLEGVFNDGKKVLNFFIISVVFGVIGFLCTIPTLRYQAEIMSLLELQNVQVMFDRFQQIQSNPGYVSARNLQTILQLVWGLIGIKFMFATYLVIDKDMNAQEALKKSWSMTNGNFFRIILFSLSFIGWLLLSVVTCGLALFYVLPLYNTALAFFYLVVLKEQGMEQNNEEEEIVEEDPLNVYYE